MNTFLIFVFVATIYSYALADDNPTTATSPFTSSSTSSPSSPSPQSTPTSPWPTTPTNPPTIPTGLPLPWFLMQRGSAAIRSGLKTAEDVVQNVGGNLLAGQPSNSLVWG